MITTIALSLKARHTDGGVARPCASLHEPRSAASAIIAAVRASPQVRHPYVWRKPGVCGGSPVVRGTRFPVRSVVIYVLRQGMTPEEMVREWPHLKLEYVYDALSFYYDHRTEIDREIRHADRLFARQAAAK